MSESIKSLELLAEQFGKLGGVGKRTAMRLAFSVVDMTEAEAERFAEAILEAKRNIHCCPVCQNLTDLEVCPICSDTTRDRTTVCVVADTRSLMAIEKVREYSGVYHVLHGMLSPMQNITPDDIKLRELIERVASEDIREVIAFPKAQNASEIMTACPSAPDAKALSEQGIEILCPDLTSGLETGDGVLVEPDSCDLHRGDLKDRNGYLELHSRSCALHTLIDYESVSHSGLVTGKSLDLGCTGDLGPRIQPGGLRLGPLAGTVCAGSSLWTSSL